MADQNHQPTDQPNDRLTFQPTARPADMRDHLEVTFPICRIQLYFSHPKKKNKLVPIIEIMLCHFDNAESVELAFKQKLSIILQTKC